MDDKDNPTSCGCSLDFFGALTIAFIVLRLCNVIAWPLWVILSPLWVPLAVVAVIVLVIAIVSAISDSHS